MTANAKASWVSAWVLVTSAICALPALADGAQIVNDPRLDGVYFSADSNQNGVCRTLGYERAADGAMQKSGTAVGAVVVVDENGRVVSGGFVDSRSGYYVSQILCLNQLSTPAVTDQVRIIDNPAANEIRFSADSNEDGVCRAMGFERAADGAMQKSGAAAGPVIIVNQEGRISGGQIVDARQGYWVSQLLCVNQVTTPTLAPVFVQNPQLPNSNGIDFSSDSSADGVCRTLGYLRAVQGTVQTSGAAVGDVVTVNDAGVVISGSVVTAASGYWINSLLCQ